MAPQVGPPLLPSGLHFSRDGDRTRQSVVTTHPRGGRAGATVPNETGKVTFGSRQFPDLIRDTHPDLQERHKIVWKKD